MKVIYLKIIIELINKLKMSGSNQITRSEDFDITKVSYSEPKKLAHGGNAVYVQYEGSSLILQTPQMVLPWSMGKYESADSVKYSIDLSFKGLESDEKMQKFHNVLSELDKKLVCDGVTNSMSWMKKKKVSEDIMKEFFSSQLKVSKNKETGEADGKYPPVFKVKVPYRDGVFGCNVYDSKKNLLEGDLNEVLVKGSQVQCLIQCVGLWFAGGKYGCSWKVVQMKVTPPAGLHGYSFLDDEEEDVVDEEEEEDMVEDDELEEEED